MFLTIGTVVQITFKTTMQIPSEVGLDKPVTLLIDYFPIIMEGVGCS